MMGADFEWFELVVEAYCALGFVVLFVHVARDWLFGAGPDPEAIDRRMPRPAPRLITRDGEVTDAEG